LLQTAGFLQVRNEVLEEVTVVRAGGEALWAECGVSIDEATMKLRRFACHCVAQVVPLKVVKAQTPFSVPLDEGAGYEFLSEVSEVGSGESGGCPEGFQHRFRDGGFLREDGEFQIAVFLLGFESFDAYFEGAEEIVVRVVGELATDLLEVGTLEAVESV